MYVNENSTNVNSDIKGELITNPNRQDLDRFKRAIINYSDFGVVDGISDDAVFIRATHEVANHYGFDVKADNGALYNITGKESFSNN